jgi:hypothetical protein
MNAADCGCASKIGATNPGTTRPDRGHPKRRLKKQSTHTPIKTVTMIDDGRLKSGNRGSGKNVMKHHVDA